MAVSRRDNYNPFFEDEDQLHANSVRREREELGYLKQRQRQVEDNTLASTRRCVESIYDSENIGNATAEELLVQGEQLRNVEEKVDEINKTMTTTQKHINGMKSIFGGIKNWFAREAAKKDAPTTSASESDLKRYVAQRANDPTVSEQQRRLAQPYNQSVGDTSGFGAGTSSSSTPVSQQDSMQIAASRRMENSREQEIQENLGEMASGISRLKVLATALGKEVDDQNEVLDRLHDKTDKADSTIKGQNTQMLRILKR